MKIHLGTFRKRPLRTHHYKGLQDSTQVGEFLFDVFLFCKTIVHITKQGSFRLQHALQGPLKGLTCGSHTGY